MIQKYSLNEPFSIAEARHLVRDLFEPNPFIYWVDFLGTLIVGMAGFTGLRRLPWNSIPQAITVLAMPAIFVLTVLAFYRASLFTHELTHLKRGSFKTFRVVWNVLYGIPFLVPSFLYHTHVDHHARRQYGTLHDGEYLPLASSPRWKIVWYLLESFVVPVLAVVRFLIVPLTWFTPTLRTWLARHLSAMVIDPTYVRPLPTRQEVKIWRLQETACWAFVSTVAVLLTVGKLPMGFLYTAYAVSVGVMLLNSLRTLGAHRYRSGGEPMTIVDQLMDSINYPCHRITNELWAPVGLRFHALHHLFPSMPYHNLAEAHERLMSGLPADSPYRSTVSESLWQSIHQLWQEAKSHEVQRDPRGQFPVVQAPSM